jgi:hypothetical protein
MDITALVTNGYLHMVGYGGGGCGNPPFIVGAEDETPDITGSKSTDVPGPIITGGSTQSPGITGAQDTPTTEPTAPSIIGSKVEKPSIR